MTSLVKLIFHHRFNIKYTECKRFAGHSKWANIRHTKMEKDHEKAVYLQQLTQKMKVAIAEKKSAKPEDNVKLARLIEQAKKNSMPMATIRNFLDKMQNSKTQSQTAVVESRGPSGCVVLIQLLCDNVQKCKYTINSHLKKVNFSPCEIPNYGMYEQKGIILTEVENRELDKALDDAIEVGAEEVEKLKENDIEFLQFTCYPTELHKIQNKLENLNYKIIRSDVEYIPKLLVKLTDEEMELVSKLFDRLDKVEEVVHIYTNVS